MEYQNPRPVAILLQPVLRSGGFLLVERGDGAGWALPGGGMEMDETAEEAAIRETREEVGYEATNVRLVSSAVAANRALAIFCISQNFADWTEINQVFVPNREVLSIRVSLGAEELCFPTHTAALRRALGFQ